MTPVRGLLAGVVAALTLALALPAESARTEPPASWPADVDFMTRGSGAWETPNPAAASDPEAPEAYGMQWTRVNDGAGLTGRLNGVRDGHETGECGPFSLATGDPASRAAVIAG